MKRSPQFRAAYAAIRHYPVRKGEKPYFLEMYDRLRQGFRVGWVAGWEAAQRASHKDTGSL